MSLYNEDRIRNALGILGSERVNQGLTAFDHEPVGTFCNCFATEAFAPEIAFYTKKGREVRGKIDPRYHIACFRDDRRALSSPTALEHLGYERESETFWDISDNLGHLFNTGYEDNPEKLINTIIQWLEENE